MNNIIKNAFIDAECSGILSAEHTFSKEFEENMQKLLRQQKGILRLVNTAGKRVACVILAVLICLTTTVFSVDALREPIVKAIEEFYVGVKEKLRGTQADNIAEYFSDDITSIVATNLITEKHKVYIIDEPEKISKFVALLTETEWGEPYNEWAADTDYVQYRFEFKSEDKTVTTINMCSNIDWFGIVEIITDGKATVYNISERTFYDILAFTTQKYYLHKSDLELPDHETCMSWQKEAYEGLDYETKQRLCKNFRKLHTDIEEFLLSNVARLKEPDSIYWGPLLRPEIYINREAGILGDDSQYFAMLRIFDAIILDIKHQKTLDAVNMMRTDYVEAMQNHDLGALFTVHEYIHDYDYYVINYPVQYVLTPPDWGGIDDYFGKIE